MKMNLLFTRVIALILCALLIQTMHANNNTSVLRAPITLSPEGINTFLRTTFNNPAYAQEILPHDFSHFIQLLQNGKNIPQHRRAYIKSALKLFANKIKGAQYINAYAFSLMLDQLPDLVAEYFSPKHAIHTSESSKKVYTILEETFLNKFEQFKEKPREFLDALSCTIIDNLEKDIELISSDISIEQLRQSIVRFLESCINKLVWSPEDKEAIWDSVKKISCQLEQLAHRNIIADSSDLDDLYWSLIHRFCFFLDIAGSDLPVEFYESVRNDIAAQQLSLLELEEQEKSILPKATYLSNALLTGEAKKRALDHGIVAR